MSALFKTKITTANIYYSTRDSLLINPIINDQSKIINHKMVADLIARGFNFSHAFTAKTRS